MKKITTALLTAAMLVSATGFVPVSAQDTQAVSFAVMADGIEYTPEKAEAENEYYVELLNSERSESPVLEVVADEGAEVAVTVDDTAAQVTDNKVALGDYGLHDIDITVTSEEGSQDYTIHIYPTVYMVNYVVGGSNDKYTWGGTIEMEGNPGVSNAAVVTKDDIVSDKLGLYDRWQYTGMTAANYYPDFEYAGLYEVYAWETYNTGCKNVYASATATVTHNSVTDTNSNVTWYENPADWSYVGSYYFDGTKDAQGKSTECVSLSINSTKTALETGSGTDSQRVSSIKLVMVEDYGTKADLAVVGNSLGKEYTLTEEADGTNGEKNYSFELLESEGAKLSIDMFDDNAQLEINGEAAEAQNGVYTLDLAYEYDTVEVKVINGNKSQVYNITVYPTYYIAPNYDKNGTVKETGYSSNISVVIPPEEFSFLGLSATNSSLSGSNSYTYTPNVPAGEYKVMAWTTYNKSQGTVYGKAEFEVCHNGTTDTNSDVTWYTSPATWQTVGEYTFCGNGSETITAKIIREQTIATGLTGGTDQFRASAIKLVKLGSTKADLTVTGKLLNKEYNLTEEADGANGEKNYSFELLESEGATLTIDTLDENVQVEVNGEAAEAQNGVYTVDLAYKYGTVSVKVVNGNKSQVYNITVYPTYYIAPNYAKNGTVKETGYSNNISVVIPPEEFSFLGLSATNSSLSGSNSYTYTPNVPAGEYKVMAWTTYANNQGTVYGKAEFEVYHNGTTDTNSDVTWYTSPATWQTVGEYTFCGNGSETITAKMLREQTIATGLTGGKDQFRASAIKLVKVGESSAVISSAIKKDGVICETLSAGDYTGSAENAGEAVVILAKYNGGGTLADVEIAYTQNGAAQTEAISISEAEIGEGASLKLFVFDGFDLLKPLLNAKGLPNE